MKNKDLKLNLNDIPAQLSGVLKKLRTYRLFIFIIFIASIYSYIVWRINVYSNAPASTSEETAQTTSQPRIDQATVDKIQSLQDNSVNVQSLFDQARDNPFQE